MEKKKKLGTLQVKWNSARIDHSHNAVIIGILQKENSHKHGASQIPLLHKIFRRTPKRADSSKTQKQNVQQSHQKISKRNQNQVKPILSLLYRSEVVVGSVRNLARKKTMPFFCKKHHVQIILFTNKIAFKI